MKAIATLLAVACIALAGCELKIERTADTRKDVLFTNFTINDGDNIIVWRTNDVWLTTNTVVDYVESEQEFEAKLHKLRLALCERDAIVGRKAGELGWLIGRQGGVLQDVYDVVEYQRSNNVHAIQTTTTPLTK